MKSAILKQRRCENTISRFLLVFSGVIFLSSTLMFAQTKGQFNPIIQENSQTILQVTGVEKTPDTGNDTGKKNLTRLKIESILGWQNIMTEDFEGDFPSSDWQAYAQSGYTNAYWNDASCKPNNGDWSAFCANLGSQSVSCGQDYPNDMNAWMKYGPFDLSNASDAELLFSYWNKSESDYDYFKVFASVDNSAFYGWKSSGNSNGWITEKFDLTDVYVLGNLLGQSQVWIAFNFSSDGSTTAEGAFVDDIILRKYASDDGTPSAPILSLPVDGTTGQSTTSTLSWNTSSTGATSYTLQVSTSSSFTSYVYNESGLTNTSQQIAGLNISTTYYWHVSATNSIGTSSYSSTWSFTTQNPNFTCGSPISYSGKTYNTIQIGTQCWFKENLDVGTRIQSNIHASDNGFIEKKCYYNNINNCNAYGGLYEWDEAMTYSTTPSAKGICPDGWHIPTKSEFETLKSSVNNQGNALKAVGQGDAFWGGAGTNTSGFSALLAGSHDYDGHSDHLGYYTDFWSSTKYGIDNAIDMGLNFMTNGITLSSSINLYYNGFSIRCLKDKTGTAVEDDNKNGLPTEYILSQNYPNPFNPATTINYSVPKESFVTIKVYDALGKEVATIVNENKASGNYYVEFNASNLASGTYFYRITAGDFTDVKKLILLR